MHRRRSVNRIEVLAASFVALLVPTAGWAGNWTHTWCTSGASLVLPAPSGTDPNSVRVVEWVCGDGGFADCCATGGRWTLECVQRGAAKARQEAWRIENSDDYCGRYAWAQGPIANQEQYYPRDFNLFVTGSEISSFQDVQGPVASAGKVKSSSFTVDGGRSERIGLVAQTSAELSNGTLYGELYYGTTYNNSSTVRIVDASGNVIAPRQKSDVIDFSTAARKLGDMSHALSHYKSIPVIPRYNGLVLHGEDPELNVFSASASQLTSATSYTFEVPAHSFVIINVSGAEPVLQNAGFSGPNGGGLSSIPTSSNRIMWNFFEATKLTLQSVGLPGSILAPNAAATIQWGSVTGTIVAKTATARSELYMARYQVPAPGGCLWGDKQWSCSNETTLDDRYHVAGVAHEAGFFEIPGGRYTTGGVERDAPNHRIWYAFQPALYAPKDKPLAVLFNGGPGTSTTGLLFSFNTGTWTLDPDVAGSAGLLYNSSSWAKFANLLYIDAAGTGYSYPLRYKGEQDRDVGIDIDRDAGIFLRIIGRFLARHPDLADNAVIVTGESYGGIRATLLLHYLFNYQSLATDTAYLDPDVITDLSPYFSAAFNTETPHWSQIATKFHHQVLIQPSVTGHWQEDAKDDDNWSPSACIPRNEYPCYYADLDKNGVMVKPTCSQYDCDKPITAPEWLYQQADKAVGVLGVVANLSKALGVDAKTIKWMHASERTTAYGRDDVGISSQDMQNVFGKLTGTDNYFVMSNNRVYLGQKTPVAARSYFYSGATSISNNFVSNIFDYGVNTFITVSQRDSAIQSPSIAYALNQLAASAGVSQANYSATTPKDLVSRPGGMSITNTRNTTQTVFMPTYPAGHTICMRATQAANLLADITKWYHIRP